MIGTRPEQLGATPNATPGANPGAGAPISTTFRVFSRHATKVEVCLFARADSTSPLRQVPLDRRADGIWSGEIAGVGDGQLYGLRADGPYQPAHGHRFNPSKLLVDPYARAITGEPLWSPRLYAFQARSPDTSFDSEDSAGVMPKCVVVDSSFGWHGDQPLRRPWNETVIYECHVRGMTMLHPEIPDRIKGTFAGLASPQIIDHLQGLGVTAVELLPVHQVASEPALLERGLRNYWGYSPLGYFAPNARYAASCSGSQVAEFQSMVRTFHSAGIEVILDMVFNHTAEGDHNGPTFSFRGLDNSSYYRLSKTSLNRYDDVTGCGNTLATDRPVVQRLVLDCLRYWTSKMHVDGFRFDLASTLGRDRSGQFATNGLLAAITEDPVLAGCKLIAEPWDLGPNGYRLGSFDSPYHEWNDRFRDTVRRFWRGDRGTSEELARRFEGSRDIFGSERRSIHYVTCHDGFSLTDLVTYSHKNNEANGENNRDGRDENLSSNWGVEGPSQDSSIVVRRRIASRNMLASVLLAAGIPMLRHGDELGHSQNGNNNSYCQDNEISWLDWHRRDLGSRAEDIRLLTHLRRRWADQIVNGPQWVGADCSTPITTTTVDQTLLVGRWCAPTGTILLCAINQAPEVQQLVPPVGRWIRRYSSSKGPVPAEPLPTGPISIPPSSLVLLENNL